MLFGECKKMVCSHNHIEKIPKEIGMMYSLEELYIDKNQLKTLPSKIGKR